jgi:predicted aspartyl protease
LLQKVAAMVFSAALGSHYGINNHHHRSQILPSELTHCPISTPNQLLFGRYRHRNSLPTRYPSFHTIRSKLNASISNPATAGAAAAAAQEQERPPSITQERYSIDEILNKVQQHSCVFNRTKIDNNNKKKESITLSGTGVQLGMDVTWQFTIRSDGAFREDVTSPFVTFSSGFNADFANNSTAWDVDSSGVCHSLELDDHQATVLVAWIRSGVWSLPWLRSYLSIELLSEEQSSSDSKSASNKENSGTNIDSASASTSTSSTTSTNFVTVHVRLQSGQVAVEVKINTTTWHTESARVIMCGDYETWEFENWTQWEINVLENKENEKENGDWAAKKTKFSIPCAEKYIHHSMNGGDQSLTITNIELPTIDTPLIPTTTTTPCFYSLPFLGKGALLPLDSKFLKDVSSAVPVWHTRSGHMLAFATLNGDSANSGYFIVDTGASGFVIEPTAADKLRLESFGEVHVTGMAGKVQGKFRRAGTFQIGPLEVRDAVMMEMRCGGLVTGAPGAVIGIVGFDVFRRAVVDIPPMLPPKSTSAAAAAAEEEEEKERASIISPAAALAFAAMREQKNNSKIPEPHAHIHLHHPEECDNMLRSMLRPEDWLPVTMLSCLPHIPVTIQSTLSSSDSSDSITEINSNNNTNNTALLMVDTGAGGMAAMLNSTAAKTLGLFDKDNTKSKIIRGVGGSHNHSVTLKTAQIGVLKVGTADFSQVQCLIAEEAKGGVALSFYSSGILCGDILSQCRLVIDLARNRMAVLPGERECDSNMSI